MNFELTSFSANTGFLRLRVSWECLEGAFGMERKLCYWVQEVEVGMCWNVCYNRLNNKKRNVAGRGWS